MPSRLIGILMLISPIISFQISTVVVGNRENLFYQGMLKGGFIYTRNILGQIICNISKEILSKGLAIDALAKSHRL